MPAGGTDPRPTLLAGHLAPDSKHFFENKIKIELHLFLCWAKIYERTLMVTEDISQLSCLFCRQTVPQLRQPMSPLNCLDSLLSLTFPSTTVTITSSCLNLYLSRSFLVLRNLKKNFPLPHPSPVSSFIRKSISKVFFFANFPASIGLNLKVSSVFLVENLSTSTFSQIFQLSHSKTS